VFFQHVKSALTLAGIVIFPASLPFSATGPFERPPIPIAPLPVHPIPNPHPGLNPIRVSPDYFEIVRKGQALPHRAFPLKDPNTGGGSEANAHPIKADTLLHLPNGKSLKASEYYQRINQFEQHINQFGYTLREDGDAKVELGRLIVNHPEFLQKSRETQVSHDLAKIKPIIPVAQLKKDHATQLAKVPDLLKQLHGHLNPIGHPAPVAKSFQRSKSWSNSWGWSNKVGAFVDTQVKANGNADQTSATAEGNAGGYLFGQQLKIIRGEASAVTPKSGNLTGDVSFYFLGYKIFNKDYNNPAAYFYNSEWTKGLDQSTTIEFALGPIPMSARIGAQGSASLDFRMYILPLHANTDIVPSVQSKVYIQVGVDIVVGGAGGGTILF